MIQFDKKSTKSSTKKVNLMQKKWISFKKSGIFLVQYIKSGLFQYWDFYESSTYKLHSSRWQNQMWRSTCKNTTFALAWISNTTLPKSFVGIMSSCVMVKFQLEHNVRSCYSIVDRIVWVSALHLMSFHTTRTKQMRPRSKKTLKVD